MCPWESLPGTAAAPGTARLSLLWRGQPNLPPSPASDQTSPQSPKQAVHTNCNHAWCICSPCCPMCLLLKIVCTGPGCGSHIPGTGSSCTGVGKTAHTTWSMPCSAKGRGLLTPQISHLINSHQQVKALPAVLPPPWQRVFGSQHSSTIGEKCSLCTEPCLGYLLDGPILLALTKPNELDD